MDLYYVVKGSDVYMVLNERARWYCTAAAWNISPAKLGGEADLYFA